MIKKLFSAEKPSEHFKEKEVKRGDFILSGLNCKMIIDLIDTAYKSVSVRLGGRHTQQYKGKDSESVMSALQDLENATKGARKATLDALKDENTTFEILKNESGSGYYIKANINTVEDTQEKSHCNKP